MPDIPVQLFDGPFYEARKQLDNPGPSNVDPLDCRPGGTRVTNSTLNSLVTFNAKPKQTNPLKPPADDIHLMQVHRLEHAIHQDLVIANVDRRVVPTLKRNIRHWFALRQERLTKTITLPESYVRALQFADPEPGASL